MDVPYEEQVPLLTHQSAADFALPHRVILLLSFSKGKKKKKKEKKGMAGGRSRTESFSLSGFLWSDGLGISSPFSPPVVRAKSGGEKWNRFH